MKRLSKTLRKSDSKRIQKAGLPPGSLIYTGKKEKTEPLIIIIDYNKEDYDIQKFKEVPNNLIEIEKSKIRWINLEGIEFVEIVEKIGKQYELHPLLLEDILSISQRPKIEIYKDYIAVFLRILNLNKDEIEYEQTCLILGKNYILSFEENEKKAFSAIRDRIIKMRGKVREMSADYLLYILIDVIIDNYFIILERLGENIADLELKLIDEQSPAILNKIQVSRRDILELRRYIWPLREMFNRIQKEAIPLINESVQLFLRDVYDHLVHISDRIEHFRDILTGLIEIYQSNLSNRMNEIINVLTIVMTIFIPLSFLAGFFGINYIVPDAYSPVALIILTIIMTIIGFLMIYFFRRRKWL